MQYNYDFEIMSLVIFVVISGHFLLIRQFPTVKSKVFGRLLWVCLGECIANILSCIGLANAAIVPLIWNELFAFAFFCVGRSGFLSDVPLYGRGMQLFRSSRSDDKIHGKSSRFSFLEIMLLATPWMGLFTFILKMASYYRG